MGLTCTQRGPMFQPGSRLVGKAGEHVRLLGEEQGGKQTRLLGECPELTGRCPGATGLCGGDGGGEPGLVTLVLLGHR